MDSHIIVRMSAGAVLMAAALVGGVAFSPPAQALEPINPVVVNPADPANTGFLVFVENDVTIQSDESEGTMAMGGDLRILNGYNIAAGAAPARPTYTAPGDARPTFLHVGGGVSWGGPGLVVYVENQGFTKIGDTSTYDAYDRDTNNALVNYRIVPEGAGYASSSFIEGRSNAQSPASVGQLVDLDFGGAFATYRDLTQQMAACADTVQLTDTSGAPLSRPIAEGAQGRLALEPGRTNVLQLTAAELDALAEINFLDQPSATTPLLVNITGTSFTGSIPNLAGISGAQAPYILWNFADATAVTVTGGDSIEGTIYAPNADLNWVPTQNIEGNVIARSFIHGGPLRGSPREIHDFPFNTTLSCAAAAPSAELTLIKRVVNDNGGTADAGDWTLNADGPTDVTGTTGSAAVTDVQVTPGNYELTETGGPSGYDPSAWTCDGGTLNDATLTLTDGDDVTCTIVNDDRAVPPDQPRLTLVKEVVNDDGGTADPADWTLSAGGPTDVTGTTGTTAVTDAPVTPGNYELTETGGPSGYDPSNWACNGGTLNDATLTLANGDDVTCTIVNDDEAEATDVEGDGPEGGNDDAGVIDGLLPSAGSAVSPWAVAAAVAMVAGGAVLVATGRRRRKTSRAS